MIRIHDRRRILQISLIIFFQQELQILIMIVRDRIAMFIHCSAKNCMSQRIAVRLSLPVSVDKVLFDLCCQNRIQHHRQIPTGWIFHTHWNIHTACYHTMLLILHRASSNSNIRKNIIQISPGFRIQHFVGCCQTRFLDGTHMHLTDSDQTMQQIRFLLRIRLMKDPFVTLSGCSRFVCIDSRNQDQLICHFFLYPGQTVDIFTNCLFVICGTRSDDDQKLIGLSGKYFSDHLISLRFDLCHFLCHRIISFDLRRCWQFFQQLNTHNNFSPLISSGVLWYKHP